MIYALPGDTYESVFVSGIPGGVGTVSVKVNDNQGNEVTAASTADILEIAPGVYSATRAAPAALGAFSVIWSSDGTFDPETIGVDDLVVYVEGAPPVPGVEVGSDAGPCGLWATADEVAELCGADLGVGTNTEVFEEVALAASELLFQFSGRQFPGLCDRTARPCGSGSQCGWSSGVMLPASSGGGWEVAWRPWHGGWGWVGDEGPVCGCTPLGVVELPGYPVVGISEVRINGDAVSPATYRLDHSRFLVRVTPDSEATRLRWPSCQRMELPPGEPGTWEVDYVVGAAPPWSGKMAAQQLACELYKAVVADEDCKLPQAVTQVNRQGLSYSVQLFGQWGRQGGLWKTGLSMVDAFLQAFNPTGQRERSAVWSPDLDEVVVG